MNQENKARLKKYIFFISLLIGSILLTHIIYVYLYHDAPETPIEGGSVSEGIIGEQSHLNPLIYSNDYNKNIINLLYRSLLQYDEKENKFIGDLANCDIKNLNIIECYIKDDVKWSNGKPVTAQDVISTYNIIKNGNLNQVISGLLNQTTIEEKSGNIIFRNKVKDVNFINVLLQPIVSKETLDNIGNKELNGEFNPRNGIYSGPYMVETLSYDDSLGIQKLILVKNPEYKQEKVLISRYIFKFFKDNTHFLKHKDIVNIYYDQNNVIGESIPRLSKYNFFLNKYVSFFINEEKVKDRGLREFILSKIKAEDIIKVLPGSNIPASNSYLIDTKTKKQEEKNNNIESIMSGLGYAQKDTLKEPYVKELKTLESLSGSLEKQNSELKYISSPVTKKYNFLGEDNILISGNIGEKKVDEIYINNYKLASYKAGDKDFFYRLKLEFNNLVAGQNKYVVEFVNNGSREKVDEFYITFSTSPEKLTRLEKEFFEGDREKNEKRKTEILDEIAKIDVLEDKFYYNKKYEKFSLSLVYLDNKEEFGLASNVIKNILEIYGIAVELTPVRTADLNKELTENNETYDMILVGIDLGNFGFNIFPYFHSSQANGGYNFSNVRSLNLDVALEELKSNILNSERTLELQNKVLTLLTERYIVKTLYTKQQTYLIDKNIKSFELSKNLNSTLGINQAIQRSFISSERSLILDNKSLYGFIQFIKNSFQ